MPRRRYLVPQVARDLRDEMVFVAGPRQVGKTALAKSLPVASAGYLTPARPADPRPRADPARRAGAVGTRDYRTPDGIRVAPAVALLHSLV